MTAVPVSPRSPSIQLAEFGVFRDDPSFAFRDLKYAIAVAAESGVFGLNEIKFELQARAVLVRALRVELLRIRMVAG